MSLTSHSLLATMIGLAIYGPAMAEDATSLHKDINNKHAVAEDQSTNKAIANDPLAMVRGVCIAPKDRKEDTNNLPINIEANSAKAKTSIKPFILVM